MTKCRILKLKSDKGARQMAFDEAILIARSQNLVPDTLRFFAWKPPAITIGFFQSLKQEIHVGKAKELEVDIIRRYTGGGAILHEHEITYSLIISETRVPRDIAESYRYICSGVIAGLGLLGLTAEFRPINDITINSKKISGSAQTRKKGVVLQHGTVLIKTDVEKMFSLLQVPREKMKDKIIKNAKAGVTSLSDELNRNFTPQELENYFVKGFAQALNLKIEKQSFTARELEIAENLFLNKYSAREWNYWR